MADCDANEDNQKWELENLVPERLKDFWNEFRWNVKKNKKITVEQDEKNELESVLKHDYFNQLPS